jgi:uncharacterized delta-60 repeat protein
LIQPDGKIVTTQNSEYNNVTYCIIIRYNTNGSRDLSFGNGGVVKTIFSQFVNYAFTSALQKDGKIIVGGCIETWGYELMAIVRYNTNGSIDSTFDDDGKLTIDFNTNFARVFSIVIQTDNKILLAGSVIYKNNYCFTTNRINENGTFDNSFNNIGFLITNFDSASNVGQSILLQPDHKIILVGYSQKSKTYFSLLRYHTDGSLDSSFGKYGIVVSPNEVDEYGLTAALQSDGKIIVAGIRWYNSRMTAPVKRYNQNGCIDSTFMYGESIINFGNEQDEAHALAIQQDGKIIIAGFSEVLGVKNIALARLNIK